MKKVLFFLSAVLFFGSCVSLPFDFSESSSWARGKSGKTKGTVRIVSVSAEKSGERDSLEKETNTLLPLLFLEKGYTVLSVSGKADYAAEVTVREREYAYGWRTKRSLSAEICIHADGDDFGPLPLSAGRALIQGRQTISSSKTLNKILKKALKEAVRGLPAKKVSGGSPREEK